MKTTSFMINSHRFLIGFLCFSFFTACTPNGDSFIDPLPSDIEYGELTWTGEIAADGCGWVLEANESWFALAELHRDLRMDGTKVALATRPTGGTYACGNDGLLDPLPVVEFDWSLREVSVLYYPSTQCDDPWHQLEANSIEEALVLYLGERGLAPFFVGTLEDDNAGEVCAACSCRSFRYQTLGVATEEVDDYLALGFVTEPPLLEN